MKTQFVRLLDVFLLAPFLLYKGVKSDDTITKIGLVAIGVSTAVYNGLNYLEKRKRGAV